VSKPKLVGVTGGIGSGKTTICKIFEVLGFKTYYADDRAKFLMENDSELINTIKSIFGIKAYQNGNLNRKEIGSQVFHDQQLLERLNRAVHPSVRIDFERWVEENRSQKLLLKEAALLFETGSYRELDFNILVIADEETRIQRVLARDPQRNEADVKSIIGKQLPDTKKIPLADFIIDNSGNESIIQQTVDVYHQLR